MNPVTGTMASGLSKPPFSPSRERTAKATWSPVFCFVSRRFGITPLKEMFALSDQLGWVGFGRIDGNVIQKAGLRALKVK